MAGCSLESIHHLPKKTWLISHKIKTNYNLDLNLSQSGKIRKEAQEPWSCRPVAALASAFIHILTPYIRHTFLRGQHCP